jgi:hypothetical protein
MMTIVINVYAEMGSINSGNIFTPPIINNYHYQILLSILILCSGITLQTRK